MEKKYLLVSFDGNEIEHLSSVLSNKTCKKILNFLLEKKEASRKEISDALKLPMNTVEYNVNNLLKSGLIEKTKNFFWSKKGKKIINYKVSNTSIIISPKSSKVNSKIKSLLPVVLLSVIATFLVRFITNVPGNASEERALFSQEVALKSADAAAGAMSEAVPSITDGATNIFYFTQPVSAGTWFAIGIVFALIFFLLFNWRKIQ